MPQKRPEGPRQFFRILRDDFEHVADEVSRKGLKQSLSRAFTNLEVFYLTEDDRRSLTTMSAGKRFFRRVRWFVVSLLMKLTPVRRVMLMAGLVLAIAGIISDAFGRTSPSLVGAVLLLVVLMLELKDKLQARDELEAGRAVQLALMPAQSPAIPGWDVWLYSQPANDVGGDLVDHLCIDERRHFVALGDVAGKALPAALLSVKLQASLRALAPGFTDLGALGAALNTILHRDGLPSRFASLAYMEISPESGRVRILNAGHLPPLVIRGETITTMERGSMVLGLVPGVSFIEQADDLGAGEMIVIYSDGVSEAMNESAEFFDDHRLLAALKAGPRERAEVVGQRVLDALAGFVGDAVRSDDVSLIVLRRN